MSQSTPPPPPPLSAPSPASAGALRGKSGRWALYGCGTLLALVLIILATAAITIWWIQRPIKPVVLSPREQATVDQKLEKLQTGNAATPGSPTKRLDQDTTASGQSTPAMTPRRTGPEIDDRNLRIYVPGSKVLKLTEREINGLLNQNTDLGKSVRLEFAQDAINAYLAVRIPDDFPVGGGKMFRARGRFRVSLGNGGEPYAILEDVSVFGLSLPKAWLGGIKGENLLGDAMGEHKQWRGIKGVKSLHVEPGALVLEVED
jgi:hypothetical protein